MPIESDSILPVIEKYHDTSLQSNFIQHYVICFSEDSFYVHYYINLIEIDKSTLFHSIANRGNERYIIAF